MNEQGGGDGAARTRRRKSAAGAFPASRIKRIIQMDRDIGKVSSETPAIFGLHPTTPSLNDALFGPSQNSATQPFAQIHTQTAKAVELFLQDLATKSLAIAESHGTHTLSPAHVFVTIHICPPIHCELKPFLNTAPQTRMY